MPILIATRSQLSVAIKAFFTNRFPSRNLGTEGFLGKTWRALAMAIWAFEKSVQDADHDACPDDKTSADGLDRWATTLGLPNDNGGYGRKVAQTATGGQVTASGTPTVIIANGTVGYASDGTTAFTATGGPYTIPGGGSITVNLQATTPGIVGNLAIGELITWSSPPAGLAATAPVITAFAGGTDTESNAALLARIFYRLQNPPKGGTAADYRFWCENAFNLTTGAAITVSRAYVYPLREGTGTVDTVITEDGGNRDPGATTDSLVQAYLNTVRPVTVNTSAVLRPTTSGGGVTLRTRMVPSLALYSFDWNDTLAAYPTVKAGGTTTLLRINGAPPAALVTALANSTTSTRPRIEIANTTTGAPVKAEQRRVTAIDTITINPDTILTLDSPLTVYPTAGNVIYAGGPMVSTTQDNLIAYMATLGPSRVSGYADPNDFWESTCAIARLTQEALNARDTNGVPFSDNVVSGGVTINGSATDVTPTDSLVAPPQILYPVLVLVTQ